MKFKDYLSNDNALLEATKNTVVCPYCSREFEYNDKESEDKLNQIILDNKSKPFYKLGWATEDPMGNRHWLVLWLTYDSAPQSIRGSWYLLGMKNFTDRSGTPYALSNMGGKYSLPEVFIKTNPALRAKLAASRNSEKGPLNVLKSYFKNFENKMNTGHEHLKSSMMFQNLFLGK